MPIKCEHCGRLAHGTEGVEVSRLRGGDAGRLRPV